MKHDAISKQAQVYYKQMVKAAKEGKSLESVLDTKAVDALSKITGQNGMPSAVRTIPSVTEYENGQARGYDLFSLLMKQRIVLLEGPVDDTMASIASASLLYLNSDASGKKNDDIHVYINSPGGSVTAGLAIYDTLNSLSSKVITYGVGIQMSMGSVLLAAGDERHMTPNSKLMIHQISGGAQGQATEMAISNAFAEQLHEDLKNIYVAHTGLKHEFWDLALERDTFLTAEQAKKMGFIHDILEPARKAPYAAESVREEFQSASDAKVPKTAAKIVEMLNNASARKSESARIRGNLVTALSQFPEYWTEGKKKDMAAKMAQSTTANDNKDTAAPAMSKKKGSGGPAAN